MVGGVTALLAAIAEKRAETAEIVAIMTAETTEETIAGTIEEMTAETTVAATETTEDAREAPAGNTTATDGASSILYRMYPNTYIS
jgi:hypothetical protein